MSAVDMMEMLFMARAIGDMTGRRLERLEKDLIAAIPGELEREARLLRALKSGGTFSGGAEIRVPFTYA